MCRSTSALNSTVAAVVFLARIVVVRGPAGLKVKVCIIVVGGRTTRYSIGGLRFTVEYLSKSLNTLWF